MKRLDITISERGIAKSRQKAKEMILSGKVMVDGKLALKPSMVLDKDANIEINESSEEYISRGGLKLAKAIKMFNIDVNNCICMDVGASTGGFTDCMIKNGCRKVYAIDVGKNQLSDTLREDPRVKNLEGTNIRYIDKNLIDSKINFFSADVSFISLKLVLPKIVEIIEEDACGVCLIKPQFEAGKDNVGKKGVVKDKKIHSKVIAEICKFCLEIGFNILDLSYSPIKGPEGNIEYLIYVKKSKKAYMSDKINISNIVEESHKKLNGGER